MIKRCITGAALIAVVTGFFLLRTIDIAFFEAFLCFLMTLGVFEMTRAMGSRIRAAHKYLRLPLRLYSTFSALAEFAIYS